MARTSMDYSGIDALMKSVEALGGDVKEAAQDALEKTHRYVTTGLAKEMRSHKVNGKPVNWEHTGETKGKLIKAPEVTWSGDVGSVEVGFTGPSAAKYLIRGTARIKPSRGMYNVLYSATTRKQVLSLQEHALEDFIASVLKGG